MSLLPPAPFCLSKLKFMIQKKLPEDYPNREQIIKDLGPYPMFRLKAIVRTLPLIDEKEIEDIENAISCKNYFDCIDSCLNMHCRLRKYLTELIKEPSIVRLFVEWSPEESNDMKWSDMYSDEFYLNCPGLTNTPVCQTKCQ